MKITLDISNVDYDALADVLLPMLEEQMGDNVWFPAALTSGGKATQAAKSMLRRLPQQRKDAILANYINRSRDKIAALLMDAARTKGLNLAVSNVRAEND